MALKIPKLGWPGRIIALGALFSALLYPLYRLLAPVVIGAMYQGRLGGWLRFKGGGELPLEYYLHSADRLFYTYVWLTPLASALFWVLTAKLVAHLWRLKQEAPPPPAPTAGPPWGHALAALLVYTLLTLASFAPNLPHLSSALIGSAGDQPKYLWTMWWGWRALSDPAASFAFSPMIFFPEGGSLLYNDYSWYNLGLSFVLRPWLGPAATYNILIMHSFPLAGLGAYLLVWRLTQNPWASLLGGFVFAFNPSHFGHALQHMNVGSSQFIPWFALYLIRAMRDKGLASAWLAGLFMLLASLCDWNYLVFGLLFLGLAYGYLALCQGRLWLPAVLGRLGLVGGLTLLMVSPWVAPMMVVGWRHPEVVMGGHFDYVVDALGLVLPTVFQWYVPLLPKAVFDLNLSFTGNPTETAGYLGLVNIALLVYAWPRAKDALAKPLLGALVFGLLALGPFLHLASATLPVALPVLLYLKLPFLSNVRNPGRFMVFVYLFWSVAVGIGFSHLLAAQASRARAVVLGGLCALLVVADFFAPSLRHTPVHLPEVYRRIPAQAEPFGLLDLPGGAQSYNHRYMMYASMHGLAIVQGALPRKVGSSLQERIEYKDLARQRQQLTTQRVRFIVVHKGLADKFDTYRHSGGINVGDLMPYKQIYGVLYEDDQQLLLQVY